MLNSSVGQSCTRTLVSCSKEDTSFPGILANEGDPCKKTLKQDKTLKGPPMTVCIEKGFTFLSLSSGLESF